MIPQTGEYVIYRMSELCRVEGFEMKCADGIHEREYCVLTPVNSTGAKYYVPRDSMGDKIRAVLSREEIMKIINEMGRTEEWCSDPLERKRRHAEVLASGDYNQVAAMLGSLYMEKRRREALGKTLNSADERAFHSAEDMINGEFSFVLGIKPEEVPQFINSHISD